MGLLGKLRCGVPWGVLMDNFLRSVPVLIFGGMAVLVAVIFVIAKRRNQARARAMEEAAHQLGFVFAGGDESQAIQVRTALFQRGSGRRFRNIMNGQYASYQTSLFDYSYTINSGKSSSTFTQTVAAFTQKVELPLFELRPEGLLDRFTEMFVHRDIDFTSHPEFSKKFVLRGANEQRIREVFTPALLTYLEALPREKAWHIEGSGRTLLLYRANSKTSPAEMRQLLDETSSIAQTFFSSCGAR